MIEMLSYLNGLVRVKGGKKKKKNGTVERNSTLSVKEDAEVLSPCSGWAVSSGCLF